MGAGISSAQKQQVQQMLEGADDTTLNKLLSKLATPSKMEPEDHADSDGSARIDHAWKRRLRREIDQTPLALTLEDAVRPLERFPEIDMEILLGVIADQRKEWENELYSVTGFNLPRYYRLDLAVAINLYTQNDPPIYAVINREMFNPDRRKSGASGEISEALRACLSFVKFLEEALKALPDAYIFKGEVRRGVKWVYPSPNNHNPGAHFGVGKTLMWYEFKSTSKEPQVMTREHFCGVAAGPRTIFVIMLSFGYWIEKFSAFQGVRSEHEVLLPPLSEFEVVSVVKQIIDPKETSSLEKSGFPDVIQLKQVNVQDAVGEREAMQRERAKQEQEQKDAELAKALQEQLRMEEEEAREKAERERAEQLRMEEEEAREKAQKEKAERERVEQAEADRLLKIKQAAEAKGDAPAAGLVDENAYLFVVFDGGVQPVAEIRLKEGAAYTEMRSELAKALGEEVNKKIYALWYVDPSKEGKTSLVRNEEEWAPCWAVALAEKDRELEVDIMKVPPVKPYRLALKVDAEKKKAEKKKIYYPNVYDEEVTFNILVEGETLTIREKTLTVPKHDKGAIVLRFAPTDTPKEETILVKLEESSTGIQHTVKVNATWS